MKRILCLLLCVLMAAAVCACTDDTATDETQAETSIDTDVTEASEPTQAATASDAGDKALMKAFMERFDDTPTVGDKQVYQDDNLTVDIHGINYAPTAGPELHLTIFNGFDKDITVQASYAVINGYMITPELSIDIPSGKSANGNLVIPYKSLAIADITLVKNIDFALRIVETKSYNPIFRTENISVLTSADQTAETVYDESGQTVYDDNDIKIVLKGINTDLSFSDGAELNVYMFNGTDRSITIQTGDVTVNGYDMTSVMNRVLLPDTHVADVVTFYKQDMDEYSIDTIDSVKVSFEIKDADTWEEIDCTGMIAAELKQPETSAVSDEELSKPSEE